MQLKRRRAYSEEKKGWTKDEERQLLSYLKRSDFDSKRLSKMFPNRTAPAIRSKVRKLRIKHDIFGSSYRDTKIEFTQSIGKRTKPSIVFDAYAGAGHQTFKWIQFADIVYAAESMKIKITQFRKNAKTHGFSEVKTDKTAWMLFTKEGKKIYYFIGDTISAAADLKTNNFKIDLVDLDTCGSTILTLPLFLTLLKPRHLVITHGEFHSLRFEREDVLRRILLHRDVNITPLPMKTEEMSNELDKAVKLAALRSHNETVDSFWLVLKKETWLGEKFHSMLRRYYKVQKPAATADCLNYLAAH